MNSSSSDAFSEDSFDDEELIPIQSDDPPTLDETLFDITVRLSLSSPPF